MSEYSKYYSSADVTAYIQNPVTGIYVMVDTLSSIGWNDRIDSGPIYGIGNSISGFFNVGNVLVNGVLELNFTHPEYMFTMLDYISGSSEQFPEVNVDNFSNMTTEELYESKRNRTRQEIKRSKVGVQVYPEGWDIKVVYNNGNLYHGDQNKEQLIRGCKIVNIQQGVSASQPGQVTQQFIFISRLSE